MTIPCQTIHYLHCLRGGPEDGREVPSEHWYESVNVAGSVYVRDGDPVPIPRTSWEAINCTDDYSEPVWMKASMRFQ